MPQDGNGHVDLHEFSQVQAAVLRRTPTGKRLPAKLASTLSPELVQRSQMLQRVRAAGYVGRRVVVRPPLLLLLQFFGKDGTGHVTLEQFKQFLDE